MLSWSSIAVSWGVFGSALIFGWWYYGQDKKRRYGSGSRAHDTTGSQRGDRKPLVNKTRRRKDKERDQENSEPASSDVADATVTNVKSKEDGEEQLHQRQKGKKQKFVPLAESSAVEISSTTTRTIGQDESDDIDAREFARQMSKAKAGMTLNTPQQASQRVRTQKQSKINDVLGDLSVTENTTSGTSSNAGADADDDLSPAVSPQLPATSPTVDTTGVSDMLETPEPGPSSLRITEPTQPQRALQSRKTKKEEPVETKKQRQARVRREREKEARRETEAQRKVLEEKQRRTAREAEGRPAKNGAGWTYASGLPANAWTQGSNSPAPASTAKANVSLLDTRDYEEGGEDSREPPNLSAGAEKIMNMIQPQSKPTANGSSMIDSKSISEASSGTGSSHWESGLPSEEDQIRMFKEQSEDSEWTTVATRKAAKRRQDPEQNEKSANGHSEPSTFDVNI